MPAIVRVPGHHSPASSESHSARRCGQGPLSAFTGSGMGSLMFQESTFGKAASTGNRARSLQQSRYHRLPPPRQCIATDARSPGTDGTGPRHWSVGSSLIASASAAATDERNDEDHPLKTIVAATISAPQAARAAKDFDPSRLSCLAA